MDRLGSADILFFEGFRLDRSGGGLFRLDQEGIAEPVAISSRALDLLGLLVERQGELVSKDVIMEAVWPGTIVEEANRQSTFRRCAASLTRIARTAAASKRCPDGATDLSRR